MSWLWLCSILTLRIRTTEPWTRTLISVRTFRTVMNFTGMLKGISVVIMLTRFSGVVVRMTSDSCRSRTRVTISMVTASSTSGIIVVTGVRSRFESLIALLTIICMLGGSAVVNVLMWGVSVVISAVGRLVAVTVVPMSIAGSLLCRVTSGRLALQDSEVSVVSGTGALSGTVTLSARTDLSDPWLLVLLCVMMLTRKTLLCSRAIAWFENSVVSVLVILRPDRFSWCVWLRLMVIWMICVGLP